MNKFPQVSSPLSLLHSPLPSLSSGPSRSLCLMIIHIIQLETAKWMNESTDPNGMGWEEIIMRSISVEKWWWWWWSKRPAGGNWGRERENEKRRGRSQEKDRHQTEISGEKKETPFNQSENTSWDRMIIVMMRWEGVGRSEMRRNERTRRTKKELIIGSSHIISHISSSPSFPVCPSLNRSVMTWRIIHPILSYLLHIFCCFFSTSSSDHLPKLTFPLPLPKVLTPKHPSPPAMGIYIFVIKNGGEDSILIQIIRANIRQDERWYKMMILPLLPDVSKSKEILNQLKSQTETGGDL